MSTIRERSGSWRAEVFVDGVRASKTHATKEAAEAWAGRKERGLRLKSSAAVGHLLSHVPRRVLEAIRDCSYSEQDIVETAIPTGIPTGVYFLIAEGRITYVGQTKDVFARVSKHRRDGKVFDAYNFIPCDAADLDRLESMYIAALLPHQNSKL